MNTTRPVPVHDKYDFYVPAFELWLEGRRTEPEVMHDVVSVSYTDSLDKLDSCQFTVNNWDEVQRSFKYSDSDRFNPGKAIELRMGYRTREGELPLMLRGHIVSVSPDFPAGGQPTLQVRALNELYRLHFRQETRPFEGMTDSEIAQDILQQIQRDHPAIQLELVPSDPADNQELPHDYILMNNEYPIVFLMGRARQNGYDIYLESVSDDQTRNRLHFHPPAQGADTVYTLEWGKTLINFNPTLTTRNQVSKVTVRGWSPRQNQEIVGEATWDDLETSSELAGLLTVAELSAVDSALAGSEEIISDVPVQDENDAREQARRYLASLARDLVKGSGSTLGLPELRAGRPVYIRGLGSRFEGRYRVTSSTHTTGDSGYTTQFEARLEELSQNSAAESGEAS
jgi:phage protein D